jgi:hypothetical protein
VHVSSVPDTDPSGQGSLGMLFPMEINSHRKGGNEDLQQADLESIGAKENK